MNEKQAKSQSKHKKRRKLFIGGLDKRVDEKLLQEYFSKYGAVERTIINREHYTDKSRGSGFVLFKSSASAQRALDESSPHILKGKIFDCQPSLLRNEVKTKKTKSFNRLGYSTDNSKKSSIQDLPQIDNYDPRRYPVSAKSYERFPSSHSGSNLSPSAGNSCDFEESMYIEEKRFEVVQEQRRRYSSYNKNPYVYKTPYENQLPTKPNLPSRLIPQCIENNDRLCYTPPTYHPRDDIYENGRESFDVYNNKTGNQKIENRPNSEGHGDIPERCDTPCNFDLPIPKNDSKFMLYKPQPVPVPRQEDYSKMRKSGFPKNNYVLNKGSFAELYRELRNQISVK